MRVEVDEAIRRLRHDQEPARSQQPPTDTQRLEPLFRMLVLEDRVQDSHIYRSGRVVARDVHHFGWSVSPDYRYEGAWFLRTDRPRDARFAVLFPAPAGKGNEKLPPMEQLVKAKGNAANGELLFTSATCIFSQSSGPITRCPLLIGAP